MNTQDDARNIKELGMCFESKERVPFSERKELLGKMKALGSITAFSPCSFHFLLPLGLDLLGGS